MTRASLASRFVVLFGLAIATVVCVAPQANCQIVQRAVGGVAIDVDGLLSALTVDDQQQLGKLRTAGLGEIPQDLKAFDKLRGVSLRHIEAEIAKCLKNNRPLPADIRYLAGLQRVEYVFVYPERNDIVLAGPAEGWQLDELGNAVGLTTNRPVVLLDDLVVALRTAAASRLEPISCSIDPSAEGMQRLQQVLRGLKNVRNPQVCHVSFGRSPRAAGDFADRRACFEPLRSRDGGSRLPYETAGDEFRKIAGRQNAQLLAVG